MTESIKKLYKDAEHDKDFHADCFKTNPEQYLEPKWYWEQNMKTVYAAIYYGWLVGKGLYCKSKYYGHS